jgi:hypothetical protein
MSGRIKIKQLKKVVGDVNINGMFEEMMGVKDADPEIVIPKFVLVRNEVRYISRVLDQFCAILTKDFPQFEAGLLEIRKFIIDMKESAYIKQETEETEEMYEKLTKEEINGLYRKLKENSYVRRLILLCSQLKRYESNFSDPNNLKENFVNQEPGLNFRIFEFSSLDLKALWASNSMKSSVKKYILTVLANIYKHTHALYKCVTSPDVDVEKFTEMLITAIGDLKKQPQLHRCHNAFKRIEQSVHLLRDKFDDYYRESVASENADMLVMNFIMDVSNQGGANATLAREFRTIINYMRQMSEKSGKSKDPNVQKIFKMLNNNFAMMEKNTGVKPSPIIETTDELTEEAIATELAEEPDVDLVEIAEEMQAKRIEKQIAKTKKKSKKTKKEPSSAVESSGAVESSSVVEPSTE